MAAHLKSETRFFRVQEILDALRDDGPDNANVRVAAAWACQLVANGDEFCGDFEWVRQNLVEALSDYARWLAEQSQ